MDIVINPTGSSGVGDVVGPGIAVDGEIALFDGVTGKLIKSATGTGIVFATAGVYSVIASVPETRGGTGQTTYAAGDTLYASAANTLSKLAKGTARQVYQMDGSGAFPAWLNVATWPSVAKTTTYTADPATDFMINCSAASAWTLTIPAAAAGNSGKILGIRKTDANFNAITLGTGLSTTINTQFEVLWIQSDGSAWNIIWRFVPSFWTTYTPATTGTWNTNTTWSGFWRRVGDSIQIQAKALIAAGGPTGAFTVNLPTGLTIDTAKLTTSATCPLGSLIVLDAGVTQYPGIVSYSSTTAVSGLVFNAAFTYAALNGVNATTPITFGASDSVEIECDKIPISGWNGV